jgi:flavin-dependent dehydrogenase
MSSWIKGINAQKMGLGQEVTVVGAGPAGCLLAIYLLRRGFSVKLFEKREATKGQPVTPLLV